MSVVLEPEAEPRLPDRYEVVNGEVVEVPPKSGFATAVPEPEPPEAADEAG
jgi:hypothetical protein